MSLLIGENIRRLRRQRDLTQEEVAAHLGISPQSVSKWERAEGYPDIVMLPALANYFNVSVDELLGMEKIAKSQKYAQINALWEENNRKGLHHDNVLLMRNSLKLFPNNALLLVQLSASLEKLGGTEEERKRNLRESIALQEQILRYGEDSAVRGSTLYNICFAYWKNGEHEKALEQAGKLPNLYKARENALIYFLEGKAKHDVAKEALIPLAQSLIKHLSVLAQTEDNPVYYEKAEQILNILFGGGEEDERAASLRESLKKRKAAGDQERGKGKNGE